MPDYYNPYSGQQQGGNGTGGYNVGAPSGYSSDDYNKQLMQQTGLPLPVGIDDQTRQNLLAQQGSLAGQFAGQAQAGYAAYGQQAQGALDALRRQMSGQDSVSAEQLRQGLAQQLAQQRSLAAGASPRNAAMAARTAAIQMGRAGTAMAGQQALAGLQERNQAATQYGSMVSGLRGQDLQGALGARSNALGGYGAANTGPPQPSFIQQYGPAFAAGLAAIASDRALKTNIAPGDTAANTAIGSLGRSSNPFVALSSAPQSIVPMGVPGLPASPKTSMDTFYNQVGTLDPTTPPAPNPNAGLGSFYGQIAGATPNTGVGAAAAPAAPAGPAWWQRFAGGLAAGIKAVPQYPTAYSDRLLKTGIKPGDDTANAAIGGLQPYTYTYKDQALGAGPQVGVMAQDLQKAGLGQAVVKTPIGLAIDPGKLSGANTAMIAALGRRVAALEGQPGQPAAKPDAAATTAFGSDPTTRDESMANWARTVGMDPAQVARDPQLQAQLAQRVNAYKAASPQERYGIAQIWGLAQKADDAQRAASAKKAGAQPPQEGR